MDESLARTPHALEIALERGLSQLDLECSAMSTKYLGEQFDLHSGGMDLEFPHHENEIAQNAGCCGVAPVGYWMHGNMFTIYTFDKSLFMPKVQKNGKGRTKGTKLPKRPKHSIVKKHKKSPKQNPEQLNS